MDLNKAQHVLYALIAAGAPLVSGCSRDISEPALAGPDRRDAVPAAVVPRRLDAAPAVARVADLPTATSVPEVPPFPAGPLSQAGAGLQTLYPVELGGAPSSVALCGALPLQAAAAEELESEGPLLLAPPERPGADSRLQRLPAVAAESLEPPVSDSPLSIAAAEADEALTPSADTQPLEAIRPNAEREVGSRLQAESRSVLASPASQGGLANSARQQTPRQHLAPQPNRSRAPQPATRERELPSLAESPVAVVPRVPHDPAAMRAVSAQADAIIERGVQLAERRAFFSARADFIRALRMVTQALDAQQNVDEHSERLARGLRALDEAEDFAPVGSRLEADVNVAFIVAGHSTPVLKEQDLAAVVPLAALQHYYSYAQQQLAFAVAHQPTGSGALYQLGKLYTVMGSEPNERGTLWGPKAMALHQAALMVDGGNYLAANELGVLLARYGQLADARRLLRHSVTVQPQPAAWHNLAVVHQQLGESELARLAQLEYQRMQPPAATVAGNAPAVRWVAADEFARSGEVR